MKAIMQIIDYLRQRGELSTGQMSQLAALGLVDWEEVAPLEPNEEPLADARPQSLAAEPEDEVPVRRPAGRRGGRKRKAADLSQRELRDRLAAFFVEAEPRLTGLVGLARLLSPCGDWPAAAIAVRNASVAQVAQAIQRALGGPRRPVLSLRQLWDFLAEEGFRTLFADSRLQGPVGVGYRAVLAAADQAALGRYAGLLRHEEVQKIFNLRMAQRQVVRAWIDLYDREPGLIGRSLLREQHGLAYWSMVILYTARRGKPGHYPPPAAHEAQPRRPLPRAEQMDRAWAHAAFMDPLVVLALLHACEARWQVSQAPRESRLPTSEDFLCPRNWDRRSFRAAIETAVDATPKQAALPVVTNSIGMKLLLIPPGESLMGSPKSSTSYAVERPMHQVRITRAFCLGAFPVTQAEYERVMGVNPSCFTGDPNRPVDNVSWEDAREFLRRLSALPEEEVAGHVYGLPTEAQWEYACRVGSITPWCFGDDPDRLGEHAWFLDNSGHETHPVGRKAANPWGLYDMYGNLWEWCEDWFGATYYGESPGDDPAGPPSGTYRILRGGSWACPVWNTCSASRHWLLADSRVSHAGFRAARTA